MSPRPIVGSLVPSSVLADLRAEHQRNAGTHRPPAHRLPPSAPGPHGGGPLAADRRCSGATARPPCGRLSAVALRPPAPLASGYRRLCPPVAPPPSRPPTACARGCAPAPVPPGHLVLRLTLGLLRVGLRPALRAAAGSPPALLRPVAVGPPRTAPPAPCPPSSLGRLVAWVGCGLRSSRLGPGAALRAASLRPRPQATGADAVRGLPLDSGWRKQGGSLRLCVSCVS